MKPIVVVKDTKFPKITLTPTRFEVKVPTFFTPAQTENVLKFSRDLLDKIGGAPTQSIRGTLQILGERHWVEMHQNNGEVAVAFDEIIPNP